MGKSRGKLGRSVGEAGRAGSAFSGRRIEVLIKRQLLHFGANQMHLQHLLPPSPQHNLLKTVSFMLISHQRGQRKIRGKFEEKPLCVEAKRSRQINQDPKAAAERQRKSVNKLTKKN